MVAGMKNEVIIMAVEASRKKIDLKWLHTIIVFLLMFGFGQLPPIAPITELGMRVLGVFLGMLYGWSACSILWPSLLGMISLGMTGALPSISKTIRLWCRYFHFYDVFLHLDRGVE